MCLTNHPKEVVKELKDWKDGETRTYYKIFGYKWGVLYSPLHPGKRGGIHFRSGNMISTSKRTTPSRDYEDISKGIHVFRSKHRAQDWSIDFCKNPRVVPVVCKKEDLIGANSRQLVFKKVTITKKAFKQARKKG